MDNESEFWKGRRTEATDEFIIVECLSGGESSEAVEGVESTEVLVDSSGGDESVRSVAMLKENVSESHNQVVAGKS